VKGGKNRGTHGGENIRKKNERQLPKPVLPDEAVFPQSHEKSVVKNPRGKKKKGREKRGGVYTP